MKTRALFRHKKSQQQMEFSLEKQPEPDRNFHKGGRSFYFFDFDDNVAYLSTPSFVYHKETKQELRLSSREFAEHSMHIGKRGTYRDYYIDYDEQVGTFRCFRDHEIKWIERLLGKKQIFIEDLREALGLPKNHWQGPSWSCFYHAVFNQRPLSLITARGHDPETIKGGVRLLVREKHLPGEPNYLSIFPVNHKPTRQVLGAEIDTPVSVLKQVAIRKSVDMAIAKYGFSPHHRFGMSDDDPENVRRIIEEMAKVKKDYPQMSFFVFETTGGAFVRREVFADHTIDQCVREDQQLSLFDT